MAEADRRMGTILAAVLLALVPLAPVAAPVAGELAAVVDGSPITRAELVDGVRSAVRRKFYHGHVPQEQLASLEQEVLDELVTRRLLVLEARRRGIEADEYAVARDLEAFERRYADRREWPQIREEVLQEVTRRLREQQLVDELRRQVEEAVPEPDEAELRRYYEEHIDKFTEPVQERVAMILLGVAPSAPPELWQQAAETARELADRIAAGEDFAALAREHSTDPSGDAGGDLGYGHVGMLSGPVQETVSALAPGEVSEPVKLLQGWAIFRLLERRPAEVKSFAEARERVLAFAHAEAREAAWRRFVDGLRQRAEIVIVERPDATGVARD